MPASNAAVSFRPAACNCDIGGAINDFCDKYTGQCACRPRVTGPSCDRPLQLHYFPDLYQYKVRAVDWRGAVSRCRQFAQFATDGLLLCLRDGYREKCLELIFCHCFKKKYASAIRWEYLILY